MRFREVPYESDRIGEKDRKQKERPFSRAEADEISARHLRVDRERKQKKGLEDVERGLEKENQIPHDTKNETDQQAWIRRNYSADEIVEMRKRREEEEQKRIQEVREDIENL